MTANPILLQKKYSRVIECFAKQQGLSLDAALDFFYHSQVYQLIRDGVSDMHCMSDAYLAEELTRAGVLSTNAHKTIYVITPEYNSNSQMVFRENILPMVRGKNVLILTAVVTTGLSLNKSIEAIQYYGGKLQSAAAVFSTLDELNGCPITSIYSPADVTDYIYYDYRKCPLCEKGVKLDALVNAYGYTTL